MSAIVVADHDPSWAVWFELLHERIWPAVHEVALRIDHVGSTAVPGLAAKPIIDLDVVLPDTAAVPTVIERLGEVGYRWRGDLGIVGREAFRPVDGSGLPRHHLHAVVEGNQAHRDHLDLRDALRADAVARDRYATLKRRAAAEANGDMDDDVARKHDLVTELLARHRSTGGSA